MSNEATGRRQVILVDEATAIGGAEINLLLIAANLCCAGWDSTVIIPGPGPLADQLQRHGISSEYIARPSFISTSFYIFQRHKLPNPVALPINALLGLIWVLRLHAYLLRCGPAVIHTMSMWTHAFAALAARLAGRPVVWHMQDIVSPRSGFGLYRMVVRLWARYIPDHILCISHQVAEQFDGDARVQAKVSVLPNTIDISQFVPAMHRQDEQKRTGLRLGTVARLTPWKGHEVVLQVARMLKQRDIPFLWRIAGEEALGNPGYGAYLRQLVDDWDLGSYVQFVGWTDDIPAFYQSIDVLVHLPITPEPFGLTLAEAMAAGLAIVASAGGGAEHMVRDAGGVLVPASDAVAATDVLASLWQAPGELASRGRLSRSYAERTFSVERYVGQLGALYASLQSSPNILERPV